jgi:ABC-type transporter lipoprotein component MlaA
MGTPFLGKILGIDNEYLPEKIIEICCKPLLKYWRHRTPAWLKFQLATFIGNVKEMW